jgi:hypothetical protein
MNIGHTIGVINETPNTIDVKFRMVTTGKYTDMNGKSVVIAKDTLENIAKKYKENLLKVWEEDKTNSSAVADGIDNFINRNAPISKDHEIKADNTTGYYMGLFEVHPHPNGVDHMLIGTARIIGAENKEKVKDKRFRNLSIQFNPETFDHVETSWVQLGADWRAVSMLGANTTNNYNTSMLYLDEKILAKNLTLSKTCDSIMKTQQYIEELQTDIKLEKYLVALCKHRKLTKFEANFLKEQVAAEKNKFTIIKIIDELIEPRTLKNKFINGKEVAEVLKSFNFNQHEGNVNMPVLNNKPATTTDVALAVIDAENSANIASVQLASDVDDKELAKKIAKHRKYLSSKMADAYDKDEKELAKKFREQLAKFESDYEMGKLGALEAYDIEEDGKNSDKVKELEKKLSQAQEENIALLAEKEALSNEIVQLKLEKDKQVQLQAQTNAASAITESIVNAFKSINLSNTSTGAV